MATESKSVVHDWSTGELVETEQILTEEEIESMMVAPAGLMNVVSNGSQ